MLIIFFWGDTKGVKSLKQHKKRKKEKQKNIKPLGKQTLARSSFKASQAKTSAILYISLSQHMINRETHQSLCKKIYDLEHQSNNSQWAHRRISHKVNNNLKINLNIHTLIKPFLQARVNTPKLVCLKPEIDVAELN